MTHKRLKRAVQEKLNDLRDELTDKYAALWRLINSSDRNDFEALQQEAKALLQPYNMFLGKNDIDDYYYNKYARLTIWDKHERETLQRAFTNALSRINELTRDNIRLSHENANLRFRLETDE